MTAAGVIADLPAPSRTSPGSPEDSEAALAWALREAVTNVVRHSGAERCAVELLRRQTLDGPVLELSVEDDGSGGPGNGPGNGLTGPDGTPGEGRRHPGGGPVRGTASGCVARVPVGRDLAAVESAP